LWSTRVLLCASYEVHHHAPGLVDGHEAQEEVLLQVIQLLPKALLVLAQLLQHLLYQPPLLPGRGAVLHAQLQQREHVLPLVAQPRHEAAYGVHVPVQYVRALGRGLQLHQCSPHRPPGEEAQPGRRHHRERRERGQDVHADERAHDGHGGDDGDEGSREQLPEPGEALDPEPRLLPAGIEAPEQVGGAELHLPELALRHG